MSSSNKVKLVGSNIQSVSYIDNSLVITPGQDSAPPPKISKDGNTWTIDLAADRKNSEGVANSFNEITGGKTHVYAPDGGSGGTPKSLNFYFGVTVEFTGFPGGPVTTTLYLAQGHYGTTNNWWVGGNAVLHVDKPLLLAIANNIVQQIFSLGGSTSEITFTPM
jgi:hypothetical protein